MSRILYIQYTNPALYPPLEHSSNILAAQGWQVLFLGIGALNEANQLAFAPHPKIQVRTLPYVTPGWHQKAHYFYYCLWVLWTVLSWKPEWVYASDSLISPIGLFLTFLPGVRVLYHEHDAPFKQETVFFRWILRTRYWLAQRTTAIVIPNAERGNIFKHETKTEKPIYVVWNCPCKSEIGALRDISVELPLRVLFHGSIVPERLPLTLIDVLGTITNIELHVAGYETIGALGYLETLRAKARTLGVESQFIVHGALPTRADLMFVVRQCDVGIAFMPTHYHKDSNLSTMVGASNKPFDYLSQGLALLVSDLSEWKQMYVTLEQPLGISVEPTNVSSVAQALQWYVNNTDKVRLMGKEGQRKIMEEWNYETQFQPVLNLLSSFN